MTFKRSSISLTTMAKWVDANYYSENVDKDTLVEYLYHLVYNNAQPLKLFKDPEDYDDFSLFCVSKLLIRLNNKEVNTVKSIVNYIKNVLSPWHAEYIRCFCVGDVDAEQEDFDVTDFADYLIDSTSEFDNNVFCFGCINVASVVTRYLRCIPHKKNDSEWSNICTSCMLTIYDRIKSATTLSAKELSEENPVLLSRVIRSLKTKAPILFHIDESLSGYISVLVNEAIHAMSSEISYTTASKVTPQACLKNLVVAASNAEDD